MSDEPTTSAGEPARTPGQPARTAGEPAPNGAGPSAPVERDIPPMRDLVLDSLGGWRGFVDAGLPALAFVVANAIGGLTPAIWAGGIAGALVFAVRLVRKESLQQAFSGLLGLAICIFIARQTGEAKDFFVFGIIRSGVVALALLITVALRRPLVGYVWSFFAPIEGGWREQPRLVRVFGWLTAAWAGAFLLRFAIEGALYLADSTTGLGAVRIALGYPLTFALLLLTYLVGSRATGQQRTLRLPGRLGR